MDDFYKSLLAFYNRNQTWCIFALLFVIGGLMGDFGLNGTGTTLRVVAITGTLAKAGIVALKWFIDKYDQI